MRIYLAAFLNFCAVLFSAGLASAQSSAPDLILLNGKIFTGNTAQLHVEAVAIRGDRVVAIGESAKMKSLAGPARSPSISAAEPSSPE
jgi:hypothetical protein